jgi:hypothetical protein
MTEGEEFRWLADYYVLGLMASHQKNSMVTWDDLLASRGLRIHSGCRVVHAERHRMMGNRLWYQVASQKNHRGRRVVVVCTHR